ncbi:reverse transcriptase [Gossypium australe]|uniref:Reverse transcriptase n=1 Tax=Gossypium australe TaxID=47621 RepID=A0A5B6WBZ8_9ROSI|nr:reverse transcriptase [Gossypium australe]
MTAYFLGKRREGQCLGQIVNFEKSTVFFSSNTGSEDKRIVSRMLGVRCSNDPERYLGLPNMVGKRKNEAFQNLKDRFKHKIDNWSTRLLSQEGKEKGPNQRGIHWCLWKELCVSKEKWGLGFRKLDQYNIALLAKQGWRLFNYSNSLLAQVLKAKYYPNSDFLHAQLGNVPSLTWRSVWAAKGLLAIGLCWRVGKGDQISVWEDNWILGGSILSSTNTDTNTEIKLVADLIEANTRRWNRELIENTFPEHTAQKILQIPLAEEVHEDFQVWRGEHTGEFTVRSAYQLLQEATLNPNELLL